jgi:hypothetical protein
MNEFKIKDCALVVMTGEVRPAANLRELYDRIAICSLDVIYHHFCETHLRPTFDDPDYPNDFAVWIHRSLNDKILAERLGIVNPHEFRDIESLKFGVLEIIDERLSELSNIPWAPQGSEFHFLQALTVVFDSGQVVHDPRNFAEALTHMTTSSIYYHFIESRRRSGDFNDDFSCWLKLFDSSTAQLVNALRHIDYYFLTLRDLKRELINVAKNNAIA